MILYDRLGNPVAVPDAPQNDYNAYNQYNYSPNNQMQNRGITGRLNSNTGMNVQQQNYIKGRPVSNVDEANASMIDFDGSLHVFTDIANGKIYTKKMNLDGTIEFKTYSENIQQIKQTETEKETKQNFLLYSDFENYTKQIDERIKKLEGNENV